MNMLYGNQRKLLKFIYQKHKSGINVTKNQLAKKFNLSYREISLLCEYLHKEDFISYVGIDYNPMLTPKGLDYFATESGNWISMNLIAILALFISLVALLVSIIK